MGFFSRKDNNAPLIPPVAGAGGGGPGAGGRAPDPYAARPSRDPYATGGGDPYAARNGGGGGGGGGGNPWASGAGSNSNPYGNASNANPYGNAGGDPSDAARNELFGGMGGGAPRPVQQRKWGYDGREEEEDFDQEEEIEGIKQDMRQTKMDSLASTRCVLRRVHVERY
jgi:hypothetical protein